MLGLYQSKPSWREICARIIETTNISISRMKDGFMEYYWHLDYNKPSIYQCAIASSVKIHEYQIFNTFCAENTRINEAIKEMREDALSLCLIINTIHDEFCNKVDTSNLKLEGCQYDIEYMKNLGRNFNDFLFELAVNKVKQMTTDQYYKLKLRVEDYATSLFYEIANKTQYEIAKQRLMVSMEKMIDAL